LVVAAVAAVGTFLCMFPIRRFALRAGFVVTPDERRIHARTTPYGGGVAMFLAFLLAILVASQLPQLQGLFQGSSEPLGLVLGAAVIFCVGLMDDIRDMSAPAKMAGQVLAAMVLVFLGVTMFQFKVPFVGFFVLSPDVTPLLTALWVIVITNAVNLIDGLDGLATGIVAIASGALAVYGLRLEVLGYLPSDNLGPLIAVVAFGVCLGFLPHNLHPARAFMGDAGALFLGLLMAASTMVIGGRTPDISGQTYFFFAPLFIPVFILGVPLADMAFAFVRRTARGTPFHTPGLDHVHYRLLRLGHGPRRTVAILWAWTAVLSGFLLYPLFDKQGNAVIPFGVIGLGLALYTLLHPGLRKESADGNGTGEEDGASDGQGAPDADTVPTGGVPLEPVPTRGLPAGGLPAGGLPMDSVLTSGFPTEAVPTEMDPTGPLPVVGARPRDVPASGAGPLGGTPPISRTTETARPVASPPGRAGGPANSAPGTVDRGPGYAGAAGIEGTAADKRSFVERK
jgi:UDP-GlcNAc:undecaprenyl-phosphate GlcNAc-1-phosphate transferase